MTLRLRVLRAAARRPLAALALAAVAPLAIAAVALAPRAEHAALDDADAGDPRAVLGRVWFDKYPEKARDEAQIWIWLGGGIGIHETGSFYRYSVDVFEFERQRDKLTMSSLQDQKKTVTTFKVTRCDEKPPFDLCLDLTTELGGRTRYYGFGDLDDMDARVPWARSVLRSAEERATR